MGHAGRADLRGRRPYPTHFLATYPVAYRLQNTSAHVALTFKDNTGGSGARWLVYSATGAQPIASTKVYPPEADTQLTAEGKTTLKYAATDNWGNVEAT